MVSKKETSDVQIIKKTIQRYIYSSDSEYFSRSAKIASYFYDRLFLGINRNIDILLSTTNRSQFTRSIKYFHTDKKLFLFSSKIDFSLRKYVIANPYNILYFENEITKLMNLVTKVLKKPILKDFLLETGVFGFAHQINKYKNNTSYYKWWSKYENQKNILLNSKKYYCEFDISSFYDNIQHSKLILSLESFFKRYLTNTEYVNYNVQDLLKNLNDSLYKAKWYSNVGLNQWLLWSDFLSALYLWLILLLDKENSGFVFKNGESFIINKINILNYSDDFMIFADSEIEIDKNFYYLINLLEQHWLNIKSSKTKANTTVSYEKVMLLDIKAIKTGNKWQLNGFQKALLLSFKKDKFKSLKNYFKRFHLFPESYLLKTTPLIKYIFSLIQKKDIKSATMLFRLCVLSESNFMYLIHILSKLYGSTLEKMMVKLFEQYSYLLSEDTFIMLFRSSKKYNLIKLNTLYLEKLEQYNSPIINDILLNKPFHYSLNFYQNSWLLDVLNWECEFRENILWVKMSNIYWIVPSVTELFSENYHWSLAEDYIFKLSQILDNLSYIKSIFISHYNENASFLADTLSLLNILFTIHYSLKKWKPIDVKISNSIWYFKYAGSKNNSLIKYIVFSEEEKHFMYFIVKFRAAKNHKESDVLESAEENIINRFANNKELFHITMNKIVEKIFSEINLYI